MAGLNILPNLATQGQMAAPTQTTTPSHSKKNVTPLVSLVSGGIAGGVEAACTYPFEYAKTRSQLSAIPGATRNPLSMIRQIIATEGIGSVYTGCSTLVIGTMFKASVRFLSFDTIKAQLVDQNGKLSAGRGLLAGLAAGCFESIVAVTPTERLKTALIDDAKGARRIKGPLQGVAILVREQGIRGLYKGLIPTTLKQSATSAVRMGSYNVLREGLKSNNIPLNTATTFATGAVAGVITVYATQPFDTVKTRAQSLKGSTMKDAVANVLRETGVKGLWAGSTMRLGRLILSGGIVFSVYEQVVAFMTK